MLTIITTTRGGAIKRLTQERYREYESFVKEKLETLLMEMEEKEKELLK